MPECAELQKFVGHNVIVDTKSSLMYLGMLAGVSEFFLELTDVDVHDVESGTANKEVYAMESRKFGIKKNRRHALVRLSQVVSLSKLDDIIVY